MRTDYIVTFQGKRTICYYFDFASTLTVSVNTIITSYLVGRCFFYRNFAAGSIGDFCSTPRFSYHVFTDSISTNYIDCAGVGNLSCTGVLCLNTNVLFWLSSTNTACFALNIDNTVCTQIDYG